MNDLPHDSTTTPLDPSEMAGRLIDMQTEGYRNRLETIRHALVDLAPTQEELRAVRSGPRDVLRLVEAYRRHLNATLTSVNRTAA